MSRKGNDRICVCECVGVDTHIYACGATRIEPVVLSDAHGYVHIHMNENTHFMQEFFLVFTVTTFPDYLSVSVCGVFPFKIRG